MFFLVKTPLHMGCGSELGLVDQPIQREQHTSFPKIEASSIKGTLRHEFRSRMKKADLEVIFGPEESGESSDRASSLSISDGRLLFFPVKSAKGVFAWITCPKVLSQFYSDLKISFPEINIPKKPIGDKKVPNNTTLFVKNGIILLEEYAFKEIKKDQNLTELTTWMASKLIPPGEEYEYLREKIKNDIIILNDDDFRDFVNLSTEVITRTNIDPKTGTVKKGALFTEEYLPVESILYSLVMASPIFLSKNENVNYGRFKDVINDDVDAQALEVISFFKRECPELIQMGGNATTGKGLVHLNWINQKRGD